MRMWPVCGAGMLRTVIRDGPGKRPVERER